MRNILGINVEHLKIGRLLINQKSFNDKLIGKFNIYNTIITDIPIQPYHQLTLELKQSIETKILYYKINNQILF